MPSLPISPLQKAFYLNLQVQKLRLKEPAGLPKATYSFISKYESTYYVLGPQKTEVGNTKGPLPL